MMNSNLFTTANFIHEYIKKDLNEDYTKIHTRFPPEPNGYLHIGHAKSICLNFEIANLYGGLCNLRFDDTNPTKEDRKYIVSIIEDIKWLGFDWEDRLFFASDYFEKFYDCAIELIKKSKAYVCDLTPEEIKEYRGTLSKPGVDSPFRTRSIEENLDLFIKMRQGVFQNGSKTLRAKINMKSPNVNMRDPIIYRIAKIKHDHVKDDWCIYPMYDFAHPLEDAIEGITHSLCTMEFEDHKPLYNWFLNNLNFSSKPRQIEFAKLQLTRTILGKRYLKKLIDEHKVDSWDDPRLPTISGLRRRGYTAEAIKNFCNKIGVSKANSIVDINLLEHCLREDLKPNTKVLMAVLDPIKVIIKNFPSDKHEILELENNQENNSLGTRKVLFTREIFIERSDFLEYASKKFHRLTLEQEVRLKGAYFIKCEEVIKDQDGNISELICTYDPETKSGMGKSLRKVSGTIHWVSAKEYVSASVRVYDYLLLSDGEENTNTLQIINNCIIESCVKDELEANERFQFMRHGYFILDKQYSSDDNLVFNKIIGLKTLSKNINIS